MVTMRDLVTEVAERCEVPKRVADRVVRETVARIETAVINGESVRLLDLGTFKVVTRKAKVARHLVTGEPILVPERAAVKFAPSAGLRRAVAAAAVPRAATNQRAG